LGRPDLKFGSFVALLSEYSNAVIASVLAMCTLGVNQLLIKPFDKVDLQFSSTLFFLTFERNAYGGKRLNRKNGNISHRHIIRWGESIEKQGYD